VCWLHVFKGVVAGRSVGVGVLEPCVRVMGDGVVISVGLVKCVNRCEQSGILMSLGWFWRFVRVAG